MTHFEFGDSATSWFLGLVTGIVLGAIICLIHFMYEVHEERRELDEIIRKGEVVGSGIENSTASFYEAVLESFNQQNPASAGKGDVR